MRRSHSWRWQMQAKSGLNKKQTQRNQVALKGRGKRTRTGLYPRRGKGTTTHGRR